MEHETLAGGARPDPEAQAGRALRRLRLSRGWSQEEVAKRMYAYGYDFHQTTIAKIEAAHRPLRVRELAHFAALYEVGVHELIYPPNGSLAEIDQEITSIRSRFTAIREREQLSALHLAKARAALDAAQLEHATYSAKIVMMETRLSFLLTEREKFASWEDDEEQAPSGT